MKLAIVGPKSVPYVFGGMDRFYKGLLDALRRVNPDTDLILVPVDERTWEGVLRGYLAFYELDLHQYDAVISTKSPAYMVQHPCHISYLNHRMRVFYDLYEPGNPEREKQRGLIHRLDRWALSDERVCARFVIGETVARRLQKWGNLSSRVLRHPTSLSNFRTGPYDYFLVVSRLHYTKRVDLAIAAMRYLPATAQLKVVGTGPEEDVLRALAAGDPRIEFTGGVSDTKLLELYSKARAVIFSPINEDLGLVALEAMLSAKPVITCVDSGEPALMVIHGETGLITEPTPQDLARALRRLLDEPTLAERLGRAAHDWAQNITWDQVASTLMETVEEHVKRKVTRSARSERPLRMLVTDNQVLDPPVGGGRLRIYNLCRCFPAYRWEITYVGAYDWPGPEYRDQKLAPHFREVVTPLTSKHFKYHGLLTRLDKSVTVDITIPLLLHHTPRFERLVSDHIRGVDVVTVSHPWVWPVVKRVVAKFKRRPLLVYDSHNVEYLVKRQIVGRTLVGRYLLAKVKTVEEDLCRHADLVFACSTEDAENFVRLYGVSWEKLHIVPNGVMVEEIPVTNDEKRAKARVRLGINRPFVAVFVGSNYEPNVEAVRFIISALAQSLPDVEFLIVGGAGEVCRQQVGDSSLPPNVRLLGIVDTEIRNSAYHAADVAINPMARGSGTNIKMFDYVSAGLPVVTTPVGARGIEGAPEQDFLVRPETEFADTIKALLANPTWRAQLGIRGRQLVEQKYNWPVISRSAAALLENALHQRASM